LLLNAGAPILTVQAILGHKHADTTLRYARLYDATMADDYYRVMEEVEARMDLREKPKVQTSGAGHLLALVDALDNGALTNAQHEDLLTLRARIRIFVEREAYTA